MHELQVTQSILDTILAYAQQNNVAKVLRIHLTVGALNDFQSEWIQRYFDYLSRGSLAEGAEIDVHIAEAAFLCLDCNWNFVVDIKRMDLVRCPNCDGENVHLERGREFFIRDMEVL
jgi:hydrogenase nickel incorporation protein HypA/HybF